MLYIRASVVLTSRTLLTFSSFFLRPLDSASFWPGAELGPPATILDAGENAVPCAAIQIIYLNAIAGAISRHKSTSLL
jgi:hypothetical protein